MFMFSNSRCGGCERVFCCSKHKCEHQLACEPFKLKRFVAAGKNRSVNPTSRVNDQLISPLVVRTSRKKEGISRRSKRQHESSGSPYPGLSKSSTHNFLTQHKRIFKKAARGKFKKVQRVPTLEPVKEEDEENDSSLQKIKKISDINDFIDFKPTNCDAYNDFIVGSLKESPITVIPTVFMETEKDVLATPTISTGMANKFNDIFKTSTPDDDPSPLTDGEHQPGRTSLLKRTFDCKTPHPPENLKASIPKDSEQSCTGNSKVETSYQECNTGITPLREVHIMHTPVDAQPPKQQRFLRSRSSSCSSGSGGSTMYYSSSSIISPLALNSHPCTPVTNPSLFMSVKDVFRTFISRIPGTGNDAPADSPLRKRMKKLAESRIECRPTYKGRYKKPASYVFNS
uniref:Uncharacterized protein n=2 Tax=Lygus hesperus TaxID=30085 RepID=A0A146KKP3_LYGHE